MEKVFPKVGDQLYLSQQTGNYWVDMCKVPYTVIGVEKSYILIQEAECIFPSPRYYDTLPIAIREDKTGEILKLSWAPKRGRWQYNTPNHAGYPEYAYFGEWKYQPYLS